MYWYKAIVHCTHLVACVLQHRCKFGSWLMVNKLSNQTVHHHSATKSASMLQDIKNYKPVKLLKIKTLTAFLILRKKTITNIFNHVNTDWLIISLLNTVIGKKNWSLENRMWRQTSGWVTCVNPSRRNTDPSVSDTFSRRFSKQSYPKYISDVVTKILERKKKQLSDVLSEFVIFLKSGKVENLYCQFFSCFTEPILADF